MAATFWKAGMLFFATLTLCALVTAALVYRYDLYEHEPLPLLAVAIAFGAGAMWVAGPIEDLLISGWRVVGAIGIASVAASTEELVKLLVVVVVSLLVQREFDDPMDGIVYGSMAGLGAALEESVFYHQLSPAPPTSVPAAELVRVWAHVVLGGIVGFPLGFWRGNPPRAALAALGGLGVAVGLHFGWDAIVLSAPVAGELHVARTAAGVALMIGSVALYGRLVVLASARSRRQFAPRSALQLWGWPFGRSRRAAPRASRTDR